MMVLFIKANQIIKLNLKVLDLKFQKMMKNMKETLKMECLMEWDS